MYRITKFIYLYILKTIDGIKKKKGSWKSSKACHVTQSEFVTCFSTSQATRTNNHSVISPTAQKLLKKKKGKEIDSCIERLRR